jgi:hypothetical protein
MTALLEIALLLDCNLGMLPVVENGQIALLQPSLRGHLKRRRHVPAV